MKNKTSKVAVVARCIFWTALVLLCIFCNTPIIIGDSMAPTLNNGEIHLSAKYAEPEVGDIVFFRLPNQKKVFVKRIVAGPGEEVEYWEKLRTLGDDEYFVLGDNREISLDSRGFGPIHREDIIGVLIF